MKSSDEIELRIAIAKLNAAAIISAGTSIATNTDQKPGSEVAALAAVVDELWGRFYIDTYDPEEDYADHERAD